MPILERAKHDLDQLHLALAPIDHAALREAVFLLLERADRRMELVDLLTIIGLADHLLIAEVGTPISGDDYWCLPNGPIPIHLFLEICETQLWGERVTLAGTVLELNGAGECKGLSRGQRRALETAFLALYRKPVVEVVETIGQACPEWWDSISKFVPLSQVYVAFGASVEDAESQVSEIRSSYRREGDLTV